MPSLLSYSVGYMQVTDSTGTPGEGNLQGHDWLRVTLMCMRYKDM